jgi:hypothetical protein
MFRIILYCFSPGTVASDYHYRAAVDNSCGCSPKRVGRRLKETHVKWLIDTNGFHINVKRANQTETCRGTFQNTGEFAYLYWTEWRNKMVIFRHLLAQIRLARPPLRLIHWALTSEVCMHFLQTHKNRWPGEYRPFSLVIILPLHKPAHIWLTTYVGFHFAIFERINNGRGRHHNLTLSRGSIWPSGNYSYFEQN